MNKMSTGKTSFTNDVADPIALLASKEKKWKILPVYEKVIILQEIQTILKTMTVERDILPLLAVPELRVMGYNSNTDSEAETKCSTVNQRMKYNTAEYMYEASNIAMLYSVIVTQAIKQILQVYQHRASANDADAGNKIARNVPPILSIQPSIRNVSDDSSDEQSAPTIVHSVTTVPLTMEDKLSPFGQTKVELYLKGTEKSSSPTSTPTTAALQYGYEPFDLHHASSGTDNSDCNGCMVILGAGNQSFLSIIDCLYGLFHCHHVVYLKHHMVRQHHDIILRKILHPLIARGYFNTETCSSDSTAEHIQRVQQIVYHPMVSHVHMTGSKVTHDAIVWGSPTLPIEQRVEPLLKATMTSELGCITPWIVAPSNVPWSSQEIQHHIQHLFMAMYNNAGANCNSPKVILLPSKWKQKEMFVETLKDEMKRHPLPVAYYPGSTQRYDTFRAMYINNSVTVGNCTDEERTERNINETVPILPWLLITLPYVLDNSTEEGILKLQRELVFLREPFCPVVSIAYYNNSNRKKNTNPTVEQGNDVEDDDLSTAVSIANEYIYGTLSCTLVTNDDVAVMNHNNQKLENAIYQLRYGAVAINCWSAMIYAAPGSATWGAYPGEAINNVVSGVGQVQNNYFVKNVIKTVLRTKLVDVIHPRRPIPYERGTMEAIVVGNISLNPSFYNIMNLLSVMTTGYMFPICSSRACLLFGSLIGVAVAGITLGVSMKKT